MASPNDALVQELLQGRLIACLATENADGSIHLTSVWYLYEEGSLFVETSSSTRKARNIAARPKASMMIDLRKPGVERGVAVSGTAKLLSGERSRELNRRIHRRYLSETALADPRVGGVLADLDNGTIWITPASWTSWDMRELDKKFFSGLLGSTPGYMLPLD